MEANIKTVGALRKLTSAGIKACVDALNATDSLEEAEKWLRQNASAKPAFRVNVPNRQVDYNALGQIVRESGPGFVVCWGENGKPTATSTSNMVNVGHPRITRAMMFSKFVTDQQYPIVSTEDLGPACHTCGQSFEIRPFRAHYGLVEIDNRPNGVRRAICPKCFCELPRTEQLEVAFGYEFDNGMTEHKRFFDIQEN